MYMKLWPNSNGQRITVRVWINDRDQKSKIIRSPVIAYGQNVNRKLTSTSNECSTKNVSATAWMMLIRVSSIVRTRVV